MRLFLLSIVVMAFLSACADPGGMTSREQIRANRDVAVAAEQRQTAEAWAHSVSSSIGSVARWAGYAAIALVLAAFISHAVGSMGSVAETGIRAHENITVTRIRAHERITIAEIDAGVKHAQIAAADRARLMDFLKDADAGKLQMIGAAQFAQLAVGPGVTVVEQGHDQITGATVGALVVNGQTQAFRLLTG